MRRFLRWLYDALAVMSLLCCVATTVLWARSYRVSDQWHWSRVPDGRPSEGRVGWVDLWAVRGRLGIRVETDSAYQNDWPRGLRHEADPADTVGPIEVKPPASSGGLFAGDGPPPLYRIYMDRAGFAYYRNDNAFSRYPEHNGIVPLWFLAASTAIPPLVALRSIARRKVDRRRAARGLCLACGYDVRATPERCPECGATTPANAAR